MQAVRTVSVYTVIGIACFILNNAILIGGSWLGFHYFGLTAVCFLFVGWLAYLAHARFTFEAESHWRGYAKFLSAQALGTVVTLLLLALLIEVAELSIAVSALTATTTMYLYNFITTRWAVLSKQR